MSNEFTTMLDGRAATGDDLAPLAFAGFAHFTAMQVRSGKVRGLDLHLDRLRAASTELFGAAHPDSDVLAAMRAALQTGPRDLSLTATVFSRSGEFTAHGAPSDPAILVRTFPPSSGPVGPLRLDLVDHQRPLAHLKHVGEATKTHFLRQAARHGFDDAAFVDAQGRLAEATIWNLVFRDGDTVVWPDADILRGVTMRIVARQLDRMGVPQQTRDVRPGDVGALSGAAVMNSWSPGIEVDGIGAVDVAGSADLVELLHDAYRQEAETAI